MKTTKSSDSPPREYIPDDGEKLRLLLRDERVTSDVFAMPDEGEE